MISYQDNIKVLATEICVIFYYKLFISHSVKAVP